MEEQYPRNLLELEAMFSTEEDCRDYLVQLRWPDGFHCPSCGEFTSEPSIVRGVLLRCRSCKHMASVTAGTIFQDTHTPLTIWFRAM